MQSYDPSEGTHVCGFVAIVGPPNAGKSTLMNLYLQEKVSIVSPKPQTTRANVTCILNNAGYQIIFIDTPGLLKPRYRMQEVMASFARNAIEEADVLLILIDASTFKGGLHPGLIELSGKTKGRRLVIALNKIDLVKKNRLLEIMAVCSGHFPDAEIVPVSALTGEGTDELLDVILTSLPAGPKLYPDDIISEEPERFFVSELIREAVFLSMEEEIPYASAVLIEGYEEKDGKTVIYASILVEKNSQKPILIGRHGSMIKKIGTLARKGIEEFLGRNVYLDLHVKIRSDWRNRDVFLREIGLMKRT